MKLSTFNLENLFSRPEVMNRGKWSAGREILTDIQRLNSLLSKPTYSESTKTKIELILDKYEFGNRNIRKRPFNINMVRQKLYKVPQGTSKVKIVVSGRESWIGWIELTREEIDPNATSFTGRVIQEVNADIMCTIEVEDRLSLSRFNDQILGAGYQCNYPFNLCIDGNDKRGIDVGIFSRYPIRNMRSHIFDEDDKGTIFSRDCAEYEVELPNEKKLWLLVNHYKSKGYGSYTSSNAKRRRQAVRTADIYREARLRSDFVAVLGDLNDIPDSDPLSPLLVDTDLKDVSNHPKWEGAIGTYGTGKSKSSKIDYILLSPALWQLVKDVGIERRGIYAPSLKIMWEGVSKTTAASDHGAVWVDLDIE